MYKHITHVSQINCVNIALIAKHCQLEQFSLKGIATFDKQPIYMFFQQGSVWVPYFSRPSSNVLPRSTDQRAA